MTDTFGYDDPGFADALGRTIRLLRIDLRIERRDLADRAGISYSYLSAIENGSKTPSARLLYTLAQALGLRDDELLAMVHERIAADAPPAAEWSAPAAAQMTQAPPAPAAPTAPTPVTAPSPGASRPVRRTLLGRRGRTDARDSRNELLEIMDRLDPDDADAVLDMARRLAGR